MVRKIKLWLFIAVVFLSFSVNLWARSFSSEMEMFLLGLCNHRPMWVTLSPGLSPSQVLSPQLRNTMVGVLWLRRDLLLKELFCKYAARYLGEGFDESWVRIWIEPKVSNIDDVLKDGLFLKVHIDTFGRILPEKRRRLEALIQKEINSNEEFALFKKEILFFWLGNILGKRLNLEDIADGKKNTYFWSKEIATIISSYYSSVVYKEGVIGGMVAPSFQLSEKDGGKIAEQLYSHLKKIIERKQEMSYEEAFSVMLVQLCNIWMLALEEGKSFVTDAVERLPEDLVSGLRSGLSKLSKTEEDIKRMLNMIVSLPAYRGILPEQVGLMLRKVLGQLAESFSQVPLLMEKMKQTIESRFVNDYLERIEDYEKLLMGMMDSMFYLRFFFWKDVPRWKFSLIDVDIIFPILVKGGDFLSGLGVGKILAKGGSKDIVSLLKPYLEDISSNPKKFFGVLVSVVGVAEKEGNLLEKLQWLALACGREDMNSLFVEFFSKVEDAWIVDKHMKTYFPSIANAIAGTMTQMSMDSVKEVFQILWDKGNVRMISEIVFYLDNQEVNKKKKYLNEKEFRITKDLQDKKIMVLSNVIFDPNLDENLRLFIFQSWISYYLEEKDLEGRSYRKLAQAIVFLQRHFREKFSSMTDEEFTQWIKESPSRFGAVISLSALSVKLRKFGLDKIIEEKSRRQKEEISPGIFLRLLIRDAFLKKNHSFGLDKVVSLEEAEIVRIVREKSGRIEKLLEDLHDGKAINIEQRFSLVIDLQDVICGEAVLFWKKGIVDDELLEKILSRCFLARFCSKTMEVANTLFEFDYSVDDLIGMVAHELGHIVVSPYLVRGDTDSFLNEFLAEIFDVAMHLLLGDSASEIKFSAPDSPEKAVVDDKQYYTYYAAARWGLNTMLERGVSAEDFVERMRELLKELRNPTFFRKLELNRSLLDSEDREKALLGSVAAMFYIKNRQIKFLDILLGPVITSKILTIREGKLRPWVENRIFEIEVSKGMESKEWKQSIEFFMNCKEYSLFLVSSFGEGLQLFVDDYVMDKSYVSIDEALEEIEKILSELGVNELPESDNKISVLLAAGYLGLSDYAKRAFGVVEEIAQKSDYVKKIIGEEIVPLAERIEKKIKHLQDAKSKHGGMEVYVFA